MGMVDLCISTSLYVNPTQGFESFWSQHNQHIKKEAQELYLLKQKALTPLCDPDEYRKQWFGLVKGTSLDDDDMRHTFVKLHSGGEYDSLPDYLSTLTVEQADKFISDAEEWVNR